ncbi:uncharacterized protein DUF2730 [Hephaestia caeni]|uniref:Uncharacterized protein DUF2730 n=1 Tax=Hephaestia caeni TaxID=645617 RepID=A0A397P3C1_9SPHN|nr:DUF2730 family protein [Hephaestia caeni]RIA44060.1 uncharacterized protein DUF2730 [Hephaestia caeni]
MDADSITRWLGAIALILSIGNTVYVWFSKSGRELAHKLKDQRAETNGALTEVGDDIDALDSRVQRIEDALPHLPSKDDVADLRIAMAEMKGQMGTFDAEITSVARTVRRIEDYLRETKA